MLPFLHAHDRRDFSQPDMTQSRMHTLHFPKQALRCSNFRLVFMYEKKTPKSFRSAESQECILGTIYGQFSNLRTVHLHTPTCAFIDELIITNLLIHNFSLIIYSPFNLTSTVKGLCENMI